MTLITFRNVGSLCGLFLFFAASGCSTTRSDMEVSAVGKPPPGMTRIIFKRHSKMLGAGVNVFVLDRGDGAIKNAVILEKKQYPFADKGFIVARNIQQLYWKPDDRTGISLHVGWSREHEDGAVQLDVPANAQVAIGSRKTYEIRAERGTRGEYESVEVKTVEKSATPTAFSSGGPALFWDRKPGRVQLETVSAGQQAFFPPFKVEEGKTYLVEYWYQDPALKVSEVAEGRSQPSPVTSASLFEAAEKGSITQIKEIVAGHPDFLTAVNEQGKNVLIASIPTPNAYYPLTERAYADCMTFLIEKGANVSFADRDGRTALHWAASSSGWLYNAKGIYKVRLDPLPPDPGPVMEALCRVLIKAGADVNARDIHGATPLFYAAAYGYKNRVKILLDAGADPKITATFGKKDPLTETPRQIAVRFGHSEIAQMLPQ